MSDIIIPGAHGIGTRGFTPTDDGYKKAANALVQIYNEGRSVDTSDYEVRRVMNYYGVSSMEDLRTRLRGW